MTNYEKPKRYKCIEIPDDGWADYTRLIIHFSQEALGEFNSNDKEYLPFVVLCEQRYIGCAQIAFPTLNGELYAPVIGNLHVNEKHQTVEVYELWYRAALDHIRDETDFDITGAWIEKNKQTAIAALTRCGFQYSTNQEANINQPKTLLYYSYRIDRGPAPDINPLDRG